MTRPNRSLINDQTFDRIIEYRSFKMLKLRRNKEGE